MHLWFLMLCMLSDGFRCSVYKVVYFVIIKGLGVITVSPCFSLGRQTISQSADKSTFINKSTT